ncbi:MAG: ribosome maturation factor RimP [Rhodospirillales bacterium]|nr:ribosome maturation factor RimP [Rhodospirillales bacterium]
METETRIGDILSPTLNLMGYDLVRVQISGSQQKTMQIMAERKDGTGMTVDDCADISREVSAILDVEDPLRGAYDLEVSSPGIDRPLVEPTDFDRYAGFDAKIEMVAGIDGRKKFKGQLLGIEQGLVKIRLDEETFKLPVSDIRRAKLLLTEELLEAASQTAKG